MPRGQRHEPRRTCIVTREEHPRAALLRFVRGPDGVVVFDLKNALPGRGAWLLPRREVVEEALRRRAFSRALRAEARAPADLPQRVERALREAALSTLSLARKAGQAVAGFEKVREALKKGEAGLLIEARDGAEDGREKLLRLAKAAGRPLPVVRTFTGGELGLAFGRGRVIHAAMKEGGLARKFLRLARKMQGFGGGDILLVNAPARKTEQYGR